MQLISTRFLNFDVISEFILNIPISTILTIKVTVNNADNTDDTDNADIVVNTHNSENADNTVNADNPDKFYTTDNLDRYSTI